MERELKTDIELLVEQFLDKRLLQETQKRRLRIDDALRNILLNLKSLGYRERTLKDYEYHFLRMTRGLEYVDEIDKEILVKYINLDNPSIGTKQTRFKQVRATLNRMYENRDIQYPFWRSIRIRVDRDVKPGVDYTLIRKLISKLNPNDPIELRDICITLLIWETGLRIQTVSELTWSDVNRADRLIDITGEKMKGRVGGQYPISAKLLALLEKMEEMKERDIIGCEIETDMRFESSDYLFTTQRGTRINLHNGNAYSQALVKYRKRFKLPPITAHAIRRGFARKLLDNGVSVAMISKILGHKDLSATTQYLYIDQEEVVETLRGFNI